MFELKDTIFKGDFGQSIDLDTKDIDDTGRFEGFASTYGNIDRGNDIVASGAFTASLKARPIEKVKMLLHHDTRNPIGVWESAKSTKEGLFVTGQLVLETQAGAETYALLKRGILDAMSIGFRTVEDSWNRDKDIRTINKADLMEISIVTFPMNESATINAVKAANNIKTIRDFEEFLRDVGGFSNKAAKAIASGGYKKLDPRDEVGDEQGRVSALNRLAQLMSK